MGAWSLLGTASLLLAEEARTDPTAPAEIPFLRVQVPAEALERWPQKGGPYLPIPADEFERLVQMSHFAGPGNSNCSLTAIRLRAEFVPPNRLQGDAELHFELAESRPTLFPLAPWGQAVRMTHWQRHPERSSFLGISERQIPQVLVEQTDVLHVAWDITAESDTLGAATFRWRWPRAPIVVGSVDVPEDRPLHLEGASSAVAEGAAAGLRRWEFSLPPTGEASLRLGAPPGVPAEGGPRARWQHELRYQLTQFHVELDARLTIRGGAQPRSSVELSVESPLDFVAAEHNDAPLRWHPVSPTSEWPKKIRIELPETPAGEDVALRVRARGARSDASNWRLPRLSLEHARWEAGTIVLRVAKPLVLGRVEEVGCRLVSVQSRNDAEAGTELRFDCFAPQPTAEIWLAQAAPRWEVACATTATISMEMIEARMVAELRRADDGALRLVGAISADWQIDRLSAEPDTLAEWTVDAVSPDQAGRSLKMRFQHPLKAAESLRLTIGARRTRSPQEAPLTLGELEPVVFPNEVYGERWLALRSAAGSRLPQRNDLAGAISWEDLRPSVKSLFEEPSVGHVVRLDRDHRAQVMTLEPPRPKIAADVRVEARVAKERTFFQAALRVVMPESAWQQALIHFPRTLTEAPRWRVAPETGLPVTANRLLPEEQSQVGLSGGETWRVQWRSAQQAGHVLLADWSRPSEPESELDVLAVVGAEPQRGELHVQREIQQAVWVEPRGLLPTARDEQDLARISGQVAKLRFDPQRYLSNAAVPLAVLHCGETALPPTCRVWRADLQSCYEPDGSSQHWMRYEIEQDLEGSSLVLKSADHGAAQLSVTGCTAVRKGADGALELVLPTQERFPVVHVYYRRQGASWRFWARPELPRWQVSVPVLAQHWTVWLRPGFLLLGVEQPNSPTIYRWTERLFGPLGRSEEHPPRLPGWAGLSGVSGPGGALAPARRRATQWLDAAGATLNLADRTPRSSWRAFLTVVEESLPRMPVPWLIDAPALAALPLDALDRVPIAPTGHAQYDAVRLLSAAQLALLVHEHAVVLTTLARVTEQADRLEPVTEQVVWRVKEGPRSEKRPRVSDELAWGGLVTPRAWGNYSTAAWRPMTAVRPPARELPGWVAWEAGNPHGTGNWRILDEQRVRVLGWVAFLATWALATCGLMGDLRGLLRAAGLCGAAALCVPDAWVVIVSGGTLGVLACLVLRGFGWRRTLPDHVAHRESAASKVAMILFWLSALFAGPPAHAADPQVLPREESGIAGPRTTNSRNEATTGTASRDVSEVVAQVIVPVDAQQRPLTENYLVPEGLMAQLMKRAGERGGTPSGCIVWDAEYRVRLARTIPTDPVTMVSWVARYQAEAFDRPPRIRLPVGPIDHGWMPAKVRLDGDRVAFQWEEGGQMLVCEAPRAGRFSLELEYQPNEAEPAADLRTVDLPVPAVMRAHLDIGLPEVALAVDVPSAVGDATVLDGGLRRRYRLGPAARMQLSWRDPERDAQRAGGAELLHWLRWDAGERTLETRLHWEPAPGQLPLLRLGFDRRLTLVAARINGQTLDSERLVVDGLQHVVALNLPATAGPVAVETDWRWPEPHPWGHVTVPRVRCLSLAPVREWLAVSPDPEMIAEWESQDPELALAAEEFLAAWDPMISPPALCCRLTDSADDPVLQTGPALPRPRVHETTSWNLTANGSRLVYQARLEPASNSPVHYQLRVPRDLEIDELTVAEDGTSRALPWTRPQNGVLLLLGDEPPRAEWKLHLHGWVPAAITGPRALSAVEWLQAESVAPQVHFWRGPEVQVTWDDPRVSSEPSGARIEPSRTDGRFVGWYDPSVAPAPVEVHTSANRPQWTWRQMTRVSQEGTAWQAEVHWYLDVQQGALDELSLELPNSWDGVAQLEPAWPFRKLSGSSDSCRQWIVRPPQALSGLVHLILRGPLLAGEHSRQVPLVRLVDAPPGEVQVVLPAQSNLEPLHWETRGLLRTELPAEIQQLPVAPETFAAYRAVDPVYAAELSGLARSAGSARAALVDIWLSRDADGGVIGSMGIDFDPHGREHCPLHLPPEVELLQVRVESRPTQPQPLGERRWDIPLESPWLPQHIDVLFRRPATTRDASALISWSQAIPQMGDLPIEQRLWTLSGKGETLDLPVRARELPALRAEVIRLAAGIRQALAALAIGDSANLTDSAMGHRGGVEPIRRRIAALRTVPEQVWDDISWRTFNELLAEARPLLAQERDDPRGRPQQPFDATTTALWEQTVVRGIARRCWWEESPAAAQGAVAVNVSARSFPDGLMRGLSAALWLGGAWYLVRLHPASMAWRLVERWPAVVGVALGMGVWMVCEPDWLGWAVMLWAAVAGWSRWVGWGFRPGPAARTG